MFNFFFICENFFGKQIMEDQARCCEDTTCAMKVVWCVVASCTVLTFVLFIFLMTKHFVH